MPVDGGVRNNPLTITPHAPARKPNMMQQGPAWLHARVCATSQEVRKWRSIFFLSGCRLARQLPSPAQAQGSNVRDLSVQELAHILSSEPGVLLAGAACNRVAIEEIGSSAACCTAHGGRQGKRAALKGRPWDREHEAGSSSRWKAPARAYRVRKLRRRGGLAHGCA